MQEQNEVIFVGCDKGGEQLKNRVVEYLNEKDFKVIEYKNDGDELVDYPITALKVAQSVVNNNARGILVCGTGIGMSIAANKIDGIRASVVHDCFSARMTREHNDSNVLCLGQRVTGEGLALDILENWLYSDFLGGRHQRRVNQIKDIERQR